MTQADNPLDRWQLDDRERRRIAELARRHGVSPQEVVRRALDSYSGGTNGAQHAENTGESLYDRGRRIGVLGRVENTPPDLSTDKKHFEGFGS